MSRSLCDERRTTADADHDIRQKRHSAFCLKTVTYKNNKVRHFGSARPHPRNGDHTSRWRGWGGGIRNISSPNCFTPSLTISEIGLFRQDPSFSQNMKTDRRAPQKGKRSPITHKGRREVAGSYACHFSVSRHCDGGAYLLSVAILPSPPQRYDSNSFTTPYAHIVG